MTHEEIIAMAKEAGGYASPHYPENLVMDVHDLGRFAALVAAKEREACAQVCESRVTPGTGSVAILGGAADAIRTRDLFEGAPA